MKEDLPSGTSINILEAFKWPQDTYEFIEYMLNMLDKTTSNRDSTVYYNEAPFFYIDHRKNALIIDIHWLGTCILKFVEEKYTCNDQLKVNLTNLFKNDSNEHALIKRLLFIGIFGDKYNLLSKKFMASLNKDSYSKEYLFSQHRDSFFNWRGISFSTKKIHNFLDNDEYASESDAIKTLKKLFSHHHDVKLDTTSIEEINEIIDMDLEVMTSSCA